MADRTVYFSNSKSDGSSNRSQSSRPNDSNDREGSDDRSPRPTLPTETGTRDCPVCLTPIENRALIDTCKHEFCFPCIKEWSRSHNQCPVCRGVYRKIYYNIRSKSDYDEEEVSPPIDQNNGLLIIFAPNAMLFAPADTGLYVLIPRETPFGDRYSIQFVAPLGRTLLYNYTINNVITTPDNLDETIENLNIRYHYPHHGTHARLFRHRSHRR